MKNSFKVLAYTEKEPYKRCFFKYFHKIENRRGRESLVILSYIKLYLVILTMKSIQGGSFDD